MKRIAVFSCCLLAILAMTAVACAADDQAVDLSPPCQGGQKWSAHSDIGIQIKTTDGPGGSISTPGKSEAVSKSDVTIEKVAGGKWTQLDIVYDKCTVQNEVPGSGVAQETASPLSMKHITLTRDFDADGKPTRIEIDAHGAALTSDVEEDVRAGWEARLVPAHPVRIGESWKSTQVNALFGGASEGQMELTLKKVATTASGHRQAVIELAGKAHHMMGPTVKGDRFEHAEKVDLTIGYNFKGSMNIDLETGTVLSLDLTGPVDLELGAAMGQVVREHGTLIFQVRETPEAAAGGPEVPATAVDFSGTFSDGQRTLQLTGSNGQWTGSITTGSKKFAVKAKSDGQKLVGTFDSDGTAFGFTAMFDGASLKFTSENTTYNLQREQSNNPLNQ